MQNLVDLQYYEYSISFQEQPPPYPNVGQPTPGTPGAVVTAQPGTQVVVMTGNATINVNPGNREWNSQLFGCFDDIGSCK